MKKVTIYTKDFCPYCIKAINLLERKKADYQEINLTNDPEKLEKLKNETNFYTVPQIFIGNEFIGGCDDLYDLEKKGELDKKLLEK
ncbi:MAG: glutaredoxin 3 [Clostridia bacterium]|nr:glutaredoxin 3 [Clostridia bacterium]